MLLRSDVTSKLTVVFDMIFEAEPIEINNNQKYIDKNNRLWPSNYNNKTITKHVEVGLNDKVKIRFVGEDYSLNDCRGLITNISYDPNRESPKNAKVLTVDCSGEFESRVYKILTDHVVDIVKLNDDWSDPESPIIKEDLLNRTSSDPEVVEINGEKCFFANGTPIIIDKREDGEMGSTIYWKDGILEIDTNTNIFSGRYNDTALTNGSITINGGAVGSVYNGGYGDYHTSVSEIIVNGGIVSSINGGTNIIDTDKYSEYVTDISYITINEGTVSLICGANSGVVQKSVININGGISGIIATGSYDKDGNILSSTLNVSGEDTFVSYIEGLEKGTTDFIEMNINGGEIDHLCCGQLPVFPDSEDDNISALNIEDEVSKEDTKENEEVIENPDGDSNQTEEGATDGTPSTETPEEDTPQIIPTNVFKHCVLTLDKSNSKVNKYTLGKNNNEDITEENNSCVTVIVK